MKVMTGTVLVGMDDKPLVDKVPSGEKNLMGADIMIDGPEVTLKSVAIAALTAIFDDERNLSGEEKVKRWELAMKVKNGGDLVELRTDEIVMIKKLIGKAFGPVVCGQAWQILEAGATIQ